MQNFNSPDLIQQLVEAVNRLSGNSRYERPTPSKDSSAEDALEDYKKMLREETSLTGKFNKTFRGSLGDVLRSLKVLPKTLDNIYDQVERSMRTNNDALNKIQKMTIDSVKANKLNSKQIEKLAAETGSLVNQIANNTKQVEENTIKKKVFDEKERIFQQKQLELKASLADKEKQVKVAAVVQQAKLNEEISAMRKSLADIDVELKDTKDNRAKVSNELIEQTKQLKESLAGVDKELFKLLDDTDRDAITKFINDSNASMSDAVVKAMGSFEQMSDTVQNTLKTLVTQSINHIRTSMSDMTSKLQRAGAMAVVSGKGILDSYRAQLSANLLESTPIAIGQYGMDAGEQAQLIKSYARELASISGTNNMTKAYKEGDGLAELHDTAKLYGLTGKEAQELALQTVRTVNQMGAGGVNAAESSATAKALMQQISSSAAYLQMDKSVLAQDISGELQSGIYDGMIASLRMQGKTGSDLTKAMMDNIIAIRGNSQQLGYSNEYAKEMLQNAMNKRFGGLDDLVKNRVAAAAAPKLVSKLIGRETTELENSALFNQQQGFVMSSEQAAAFAALQTEIGVMRMNANDSASKGDFSLLNRMTGITEVSRRMGVDITSEQSMKEGVRAANVAASNEAQRVKDASGNVIYDPSVNLNKAETAAAGSIESFNNTMGIFEEKFLELAEWASGISKNPFGNLAGAAVGGLGNVMGSAVGTGLTMWLLKSGGAAGISGGIAAVSGTAIMGVLVPVLVAVGTFKTVFTATTYAMEKFTQWWYNEKSETEKAIEETNRQSYRNRKIREASGGPALISDMYKQEFEKLFNRQLKETDSFDSAAMTINGSKLFVPQIEALQNAVYARQLAATGGDNLLLNAPKKDRQKILEQQNATYRAWQQNSQAPTTQTPVSAPPLSNTSTPTITPQTSAIAQTSNASNLTEVQASLVKSLAAQGITDPHKVSNILAQVQGESGFVPRSEGTMSPETLFRLYGAGNTMGNKVRFNTLEDAKALHALGPEAVGNKIYGGRMGNAADEGYKYRGRGFIQLSGKDNYKAIGAMIGQDLVGNPDLANDPIIAAQITAAYFKQREKAGFDLTDITSTGKAVGYATGATETAHRASIAEQFRNKMSLQNNVTGAIKNNLSNPNNNPNVAWNMLANTFANGNTALVSGIDKLNEGIQTNNKLTGQTAINTNPENNRRSEPESEKRPDHTARIRPQNGVFGSVW